jgi:O-antigen ligase
MSAVAVGSRPGATALRVRSTVRGVVLWSSVGLTGLTVAYLLSAGLWYAALALIVVVPGFVLLNRAPLSAVAIWLLFVPYFLQSSGPPRYAYWAMHRALPVVAILVLVASRILGIRSRPLGRLGGPELLMAAYVLVSVLSIAYTSPAFGTSVINLYDRVVVPMCLYLVVRLARPTEGSLRWLVPIAAITVATQTLIGALSWLAPGTLPAEWLGRAGSRTIGSVGSPSVYGVAVLAAGAFALHAAATEPRRRVRIALRLVFGAAVLMAVLTFSRGVWLAAVVVVAAMVIVHPRQVQRVAVMAVPLLIALSLTGAVSGQIETIQNRLQSEETALERLPIALASWRMFEQKPLTGWGFDNFDRYDREFQSEVADFIPEKDHASHNVYLTLLAEQGLVGWMLFLAPAMWLLVRTVRVFSSLPRTGLVSRKLVVVLWGVLAAHVTVNNFSNMRVVFGLGQWWLVLGLIATLVSTQAARDPDQLSSLQEKAYW